MLTHAAWWGGSKACRSMVGLTTSLSSVLCAQDHTFEKTQWRKVKECSTVGLLALTELCAHHHSSTNPSAHTRNQKRPQSDNWEVFFRLLWCSFHYTVLGIALWHFTWEVQSPILSSNMFESFESGIGVPEGIYGLLKNSHPKVSPIFKKRHCSKHDICVCLVHEPPKLWPELALIWGQMSGGLFSL